MHRLHAFRLVYVNLVREALEVNAQTILDVDARLTRCPEEKRTTRCGTFPQALPCKVPHPATALHLAASPITEHPYNSRMIFWPQDGE